MTKFADLDLKPEILTALNEMGYTELTPIQEQTFPHIFGGRDMLARAETGSGKTSACVIPILHHLDPDLNAIQALVLVPTRELALQYVDETARVAKHLAIEPFAVFGGFPIDIQITKLSHKVHILVATPGRLIDLLRNSELTLKDVRTVVLDEADEMLKMGFIDDVNFIMSCILNRKQTLFFSATLPARIKEITEAYLKDPVLVELNIDQIAPQSLKHQFLYLTGGHKFNKLVDTLRQLPIVQAIIFCNARTAGEKLHHRLRKDFKSLDFIHGGIPQNRRTSIYNRFKSKQIKLMVATDLASRGLDFSHVSHIINFDFPKTADIYTHRTGRTARMGREGTALTFVTERDLSDLNTLLRTNDIQPQWVEKEPHLKSRSKPARRQRRPERRRPASR